MRCFNQLRTESNDVTVMVPQLHGIPSIGDRVWVAHRRSCTSYSVDRTNLCWRQTAYSSNRGVSVSRGGMDV